MPEGIQYNAGMRCLALAGVLLTICSASGQVDPSVYRELQWRCIGPFRGGRTVGACGIPGKPNEFLIGVNNGGVWKTTDYGLTWNPIFDDQPTGSIGNLAVAPSNPKIIYVGTGEGLQRPDLSVGDGIYKSVDGGKSWTHLGLRDGQQINTIIVDPKNPNRLFVAVLGHPYAANEARGVYRSLDGGKTFKKVLYKDADTGAIALEFDPKNSNTVYADLWAARMGPWENGYWTGKTNGLYKSSDGGDTWKPINKGIPSDVGRIGFDVSRSNPKRLFANVDSATKGGIYRSDDAGETWSFVNGDQRLWGRGDDFAEVRIHPSKPDVIFSCNTSIYRSEDAGRTYTCIKGSPGGDDYHTLWINPDQPDIMIFAADQGAGISVNAGESWSSWYNQPTAQFYHVSTDNQFPYNVYGGQQESGSAMVSSRGNDGQITFREWHPVGVEEYGYVAPDPLNPRYVYGGKVTRYDRVTGHVDNIRPQQAAALKARFLRTAPILFSTVDPHVLFFAGNYLFKTADGGKSWETISPDLSRPVAPAPAGSVFVTPERRGVIYTIAPSHQDLTTIWVGTDDGLIHRTTDGGKTWTDVTPPGLPAWSKISIIDAGAFDNDTAYAAVNSIRLDDMTPHIFRTHDGGKTWKEVVSGLPDDPVNTVREDPKRRGLLFCGSERAVFFSTDDGDHWNPIRLNMPATSIRDLVFHGDDVVVGTHGRAFWILDNMSLLRTTTALSAPGLYPVSDAYLVERNTNTDTPLPHEEPVGKNPPDGVMIDYYLPAGGAKVVTVEIREADGRLVRKWSSADAIKQIKPEELTVMPGWARPPSFVKTSSGMHRFVWDMRGEPPVSGRRGLPISAIWNDTPVSPVGAYVASGNYLVRFIVDGKEFDSPFKLRPDPRAKGQKPGMEDDGDEDDPLKLAARHGFEPR